MSDPFERRRPTELEDKAHAEAVRHFAEHLKQFPVSREAVARLERDVAKIVLAANMAAARPALKANFFIANDGDQWHKNVELMANIYLCHRPMAVGGEHAVIEHFPERGTNEIWSRGWNAAAVLKSFTHEQREILQVWTEDVTAQVREFLAEKFPGQNLNRVADGFMYRFTRATSHWQTQSHGENHSRGARI